MSPIYQSIRDNKHIKIREDGLNWSLLVGFLMILSPVLLITIIGELIFIFWLLAPFIIFDTLKL